MKKVIIIIIIIIIIIMITIIIDVNQRKMGMLNMMKIMLIEVKEKGRRIRRQT